MFFIKFNFIFLFLSLKLKLSIKILQLLSAHSLVLIFWKIWMYLLRTLFQRERVGNHDFCRNSPVNRPFYPLSHLVGLLGDVSIQHILYWGLMIFDELVQILWTIRPCFPIK